MTDAAVAPPRCSLVVPVYGNEDTIPALLDAVAGIAARAPGRMEAVFVVDASPDRSEELLRSGLPGQPFDSTVVVHARNFGSFAAIRTGMGASRGEHIAAMAADLQEPPELIDTFFQTLADDKADVVVGVREARSDPTTSKVAATTFWRLYRRFVQPEMPEGGIDVFACNRAACDALLQMGEAHGSLVGLLIWMGFRRVEVPYSRQPRPSGRSAWTLRKKLRYTTDSIFSFTDLPIRLLLGVGIIGSVLTVIASVLILFAWIVDLITVPGYTPLMLATLFVGTLILIGLGIVGSYVWRAFENTKGRPLSIVRRVDRYQGTDR